MLICNNNTFKKSKETYNFKISFPPGIAESYDLIARRMLSSPVPLTNNPASIK